MAGTNVVATRTRRRRVITAAPAGFIAAVAAMAILAAGPPVESATPPSAVATRADAIGVVAGLAGVEVPGTLSPDDVVTLSTPAAAAPSVTPGSTIKLLTLLTAAPGPKAVGPDPSRPMAVQSKAWLALKATGMIALTDGKVVTLAPGSDPMVNPSTGEPIPTSKLLDVSWTKWVVEVLGVGHDEKGNYYHDLSYWELCGDGAMTVTLWYWQQLAGYPNVTGTEGYFLDPIVAQGAYWPRRGLTIPFQGRTRIGTYWSGQDTMNGYLATGRGFEMYLATAAQPPTWQSPGLAVFAKSGKLVYPSTGTDRATLQVGLNWEVSGHDPDSWSTAYYATVVGKDPYFAHDLNTAVMLDLGRDGVPVVAAVDAYYLPNWANGSATKHTGHSITIVGYDNTSNPPTYSYIDTCGHACNPRTANKEGRVYVVPQATLALSMKYFGGAGFVW
jgi:hypothetical protein